MGRELNGRFRFPAVPKRTINNRPTIFCFSTTEFGDESEHGQVR